jgi:multidrug transporter EmrE-like cation transporter
MVLIKSMWPVAIATALLTGSETLGQSLLRRFYDQGMRAADWYLPLGTWVLYAACCAILLWSYKYSDIAAIETLWDAGTSVTVPLIGVLLFHDRINATSVFGIALTIAGIVLIGVGGSK